MHLIIMIKSHTYDHDNKRNIRATEKLGFTHVYDEEVFLGFGKKQNFMTFLLDK